MGMEKIETSQGRFYALPQEGESPALSGISVKRDLASGRYSLFQLMESDRIAPSITNLTKRASSAGEAKLGAEKFTIPEGLKEFSGTQTGTQVHQFIEYYYQNDSFPSKSLNPLGRIYLKSFTSFLQEYELEPLLIEVQVVGTVHGVQYAGTLDLLARYKGETILVDWKTGVSPCLTKSLPQVWASYQSSKYWDDRTKNLRTRAKDNPVTQGWIVHLTPGYGYRVYKDYYHEESTHEQHRSRLLGATEKLVTKLKSDR